MAKGEHQDNPAKSGGGLFGAAVLVAVAIILSILLVVAASQPFGPLVAIGLVMVGALLLILNLLLWGTIAVSVIIVWQLPHLRKTRFAICFLLVFGVAVGIPSAQERIQTLRAHNAMAEDTAFEFSERPKKLVLLNVYRQLECNEVCVNLLLSGQVEEIEIRRSSDQLNRETGLVEIEKSEESVVYRRAQILPCPTETRAIRNSSIRSQHAVFGDCILEFPNKRLESAVVFQRKGNPPISGEFWQNEFQETQYSIEVPGNEELVYRSTQLDFSTWQAPLIFICCGDKPAKVFAQSQTLNETSINSVLEHTMGFDLSPVENMFNQNRTSREQKDLEMTGVLESLDSERSAHLNGARSDLIEKIFRDIQAEHSWTELDLQFAREVYTHPQTRSVHNEWLRRALERSGDHNAVSNLLDLMIERDCKGEIRDDWVLSALTKLPDGMILKFTDEILDCIADQDEKTQRKYLRFLGQTNANPVSEFTHLFCPSPLNLGQIILSDFGGSGRIEDGSEAVFG